jgi:NAD(P)-dependent dehydrogenase (short-subunit alcohol dehydrogenase family)
MPTTLIIGASRGIGQGLVQLFRQDGHSVIAAVRDTSKVNDEDGIKYIQLDITDEGSIKKAASQVDAIVSWSHWQSGAL